MANLIRREALPLDDVFDDLFRGFFVRPMRLSDEPAPMRVQAKMDITENDKAYVVHAEMPGVKKEDIHVSIDGNQVSIAAEVKREKEAKEGEKVLRSERYYGKVYRSFTVGQDIDDAAAQAKYADGVLELTLPKKETAKAKRLEIH